MMSNRNRVHCARYLICASLTLVLGYFSGLRKGQSGQVHPQDQNIAPIQRHSPPQFTKLLGETSVSRKLHECVSSRIQDEKIAQDDPDLVQYARGHVLHLPKYNLPYNLTKPGKKDTSQLGQTETIRDIFKNVIKEPGVTKQGFFIEVGAYNGEDLSNTLWFERNWNWTGLLVEPAQKTFEILLTKNRKAWAANTCLSPTNHPSKMTYYQHPNYSALNGFKKTANLIGNSVPTTLLCIPLYTLLRAIDQTVIDLFSLDTEGAELDILKTIPFDKVRFKVFIIETWYITESHDGVQLVRALLNKHGYKLHSKTGQGQDYIFIHESYLPANFKETIKH